MKNSLKKLTVRGKWFSIETTGDFTGGIGNIAFAAGKAGYARRNSKQPAFIQVIAPTGEDDIYIHGWHISESQAEQLIKLIAPAAPETDCSEIWANIWNNLMSKSEIKNLKL